MAYRYVSDLKKEANHGYYKSTKHCMRQGYYRRARRPFLACLLHSGEDLKRSDRARLTSLQKACGANWRIPEMPTTRWSFVIQWQSHIESLGFGNREFTSSDQISDSAAMIDGSVEFIHSITSNDHTD
jgi:hypothetical protein